MNNKKFADYNAGLIVGVVLIYFMVFSFILYAVSDVDNNVTNQNTNILNFMTEKFSSSNIEYCDNPRLRYDYEEIDKPYPISKVNDNYLKCSYTEGIQNYNTCSNITGCSWVKVDTSSWWYNAWCFLGVGCASAPYICDGYMNIANTTVNNITRELNISTFNSGQRVSSTSYMRYYGNYSVAYDNLMQYLGYTNGSAGLLFGQSGAYDLDFFRTDSLCQQHQVILNKTLCDKFLCTWVSKEESSGYTGLYDASTSVLSMVGKVFTFQYNFGFDSGLLNMLCYIIFIVIPFLILIISLKFALF